MRSCLACDCCVMKDVERVSDAYPHEGIGTLETLE